VIAAASHEDPQIENACDEQDERNGKNLHRYQHLRAKGGRGRAHVADETKKNCPGKIAGQHERSAIHQECKPPGWAALGPEHGAGRNREKQKFCVLLPMIKRQHGKRRDGRQREQDGSRRGPVSQSSQRPYEQQRRANKIGSRIVDAWVVPVNADDLLQAYHHTDAVGAW